MPLGLQNQFNIVNNFFIFSPKQFHYHPHALVYYIIEESRPNRRNFLINDVFIYFLYRDLPQYIYGIISTILNFQNFGNDYRMMTIYHGVKETAKKNVKKMH